MPDWTRDRRVWRAALLGALAVVLAVVASRYLEKIRKPSRNGTLTRSAFLRWRDQIHALEAGEDIYRRFNYPNPPIQALVLLPLARLERVPGAMLWFALKVGMVALSWVWAVRLCRDPGGPAPPLLALALAGVLSLHPILGDLSHGNVNIFIAFLVFGALECFRRRRDVAGGVVLALAIACKVTPALFLPYLVWKRAWRALAGAAAGLVLWFAIVPGAALGPQHNLELLGSWFDTMARPFLIDGKVNGEYANQSLPGLATRLLTDAPSGYDFDDDDGHPEAVEFRTVLDLGPANARRLIRAAQLGYVLLAAWCCRLAWDRPGPARQGLRQAAEFAFVLLGMLIFSERTWKHHAVTLVLPFLVAAVYYTTREVPPRLRRVLIGINVVVTLLFVVPTALAKQAQDAALAYGTHFWLFLLLLVQTVLILRAEAVTDLGRAPGSSGRPSE